MVLIALRALRLSEATTLKCFSPPAAALPFRAPVGRPTFDNASLATQWTGLANNAVGGGGIAAPTVIAAAVVAVDGNRGVVAAIAVTVVDSSGGDR